ncbi:MAG: sigma-54-dependent Fis family transcriptional regulator [Bacteroidetes bacterium]|nr:sigma-54-dependent Fis family transcriptional regulator [Bacteroidota bacterium]
MTNQTVHIAVVEDDALYARVLRYTLEQDPGHEVTHYATTRELKESLHTPADIYLLDYYLPDGTAETMLPGILERQPAARVIIVSGQEDVAVAARLLKQGAYDYILKDADTQEKLLATVQHIKRTRWLEQENARLHKALSGKTPGVALVGTSPELDAVRELIAKAAQAEITVGITGETGTGKEVAARLIHQQSKRAHGPFVAVNVAAIPQELVESELFGHEKGAFTGAHARHIGKLEQAHGGTLLLDELGEMPAHIQVKLLRAIQERSFSRVGGNQLVSSDFRLITATHRDLMAQVNAGAFRQDLYYRLLGLSIVLPALRQRVADIPVLAAHFVQDYCKTHHLPVTLLSAPALDRLTAHTWPGNVRELRAVMELAVVLANGHTIQPQDIRITPAAADKDTGEEYTLAEYQRRLVARLLQKYQGNVLAVARVLDVGKSTLYRMLQQYPELKEIR